MATTHAQNFGMALRDAMARGDQKRIADVVGLSTSSVNGYVQGAVEPPPRTAIAIEEAIGAEPGSLTIHLGFLPPAAREVHLDSLESAIITDGRLEGRQKQLLRDVLVQLLDRGP